MSAYVMQLIGLANGDVTEHDGKYLVEYQPAAMRRDATGYVGGTLRTTADVAQAQRFADAMEVVECWRKANGTRPYDGKPNRPLTAYTVTPVQVDA